MAEQQPQAQDEPIASPGPKRAPRSWEAYFPTAAVLLVASATAALYFLGSRRLAAMSEAFGLTSPLRALGLQEVMMAGVDVIEPALFGVIIAVGVMALVLKALTEYLDRRPRPKRLPIDEIDAPLARRLKAVRGKTLMELTPGDIAAVRAYVALNGESSKWTNFFFAYFQQFIRLRTLVAIFLLLSMFAVILSAGSESGKQMAATIKADVKGACTKCFTYTLRSRSISGRPIFQSDNFIVVATTTGATIIPWQSITLVRPFQKPKGAAKRVPAGPEKAPADSRTNKTQKTQSAKG